MEDYRIGSVLRHRSGCCVLLISGTLWIDDSLMNLCEIRGFMRKGMLSPYFQDYWGICRVETMLCIVFHALIPVSSTGTGS